MNFERTIQRKSETNIWMGWPRNQGLQRMTNAGLVTGISNVTQGHGLDIKPYGLYTAEASPGRGQRAFNGDASAGVDLFYNPTPLLRTNLTINTDFAQTEVDQRQVNLTRFSLFFPEKRDFFLDGATFFDFGSPTNADLRINPFFSRRIGLSAASTPQKVDFGTKITGQVGGQDVGMLHVRTGDDEGMVGEDFTVARVKRRLLQQSYLGAIYTRRDARSSVPALTACAAHQRPRLPARHFALSRVAEPRDVGLAAARHAARRLQRQRFIRRHPELSQRSLERQGRRHRGAGAFRSERRLRDSPELPPVRAGADVLAATEQSPVHQALHLRRQRRPPDRPAQRAADTRVRSQPRRNQLPLPGDGRVSNQPDT
jgi:hypothetical protein